MAKVICTELQKEGASGPNITLDTSKNVTCENNLTVDGATTLTGTVTGDNDTLSHRNIIVNGACQIAQRGSSTTANKFLVDRWRLSYGDHNETPTQSHHALTSSDTGPWEKGFRRSYHVQNGNQTDAVSATDRLYTEYRIEARDIANSGWDYHEPTSYLTMSFWVKASVAQTYYVCVHTFDGTAKMYSFAYTLAANTWKHITHSIPGHADLTFDDNNVKGMTISFEIFRGTNYTHSGATNGSWRASDGGAVSLDQTSTVWSTNDSTWEATGFQLEVGSTATEYEHRSYGDELARCQRYYYMHVTHTASDPDDKHSLGQGAYYTSTEIVSNVSFPIAMRAKPTLESTNSSTGGGAFVAYRDGTSDFFNLFYGNKMEYTHGEIHNSEASQISGTAGHGCLLRLNQDAGDGTKLAFSAEFG